PGPLLRGASPVQRPRSSRSPGPGATVRPGARASSPVRGGAIGPGGVRADQGATRLPRGGERGSLLLPPLLQDARARDSPGGSEAGRLVQRGDGGGGRLVPPARRGPRGSI